MHPVNTAASTRGRSVTAGSPCPALCSPQDDSLLGTCRSDHPVLLAWTGNPSVINWPFLNGCVIACLTVCLYGNVTVCLAVWTTVHLITCFSPLLPVDFINSTWCFKGATSKIFFTSLQHKIPICRGLIVFGDQYQRLNSYFINCWDFWLQKLTLYWKKH